MNKLKYKMNKDIKDLRNDKSNQSQYVQQKTSTQLHSTDGKSEQVEQS